MLLEQGPRLPTLIVYGIGLICLCIVMYMLGIPMTLWTLHFPLDQTDSSVLEGFSLPTALSDHTPQLPITSTPDTPTGVKRAVIERLLLRPPNPAV